jgi:hypothetical protein
VRPDVVSIVAGGWSASAVDLDRLPGIVIGVNDAGILIPCDFAVSMDRLWSEGRWPDLVKRQRETYLRDAAAKNVDRPDWLHLFGCDYKSSIFSHQLTTLNGTNSGFCGLNLAFILRPVRLLMFGFDMNRSPDGRAYWHAPYPWSKPQGNTKDGKYAEWAGQFEAAARSFRDAGISVFNVSATSAIQAFARITPKQFRSEFP